MTLISDESIRMPQRAPAARLLVPLILIAFFVAIRLSISDIAALAGFEDDPQLLSTVERFAEALIWLSAVWLIGRGVAMLITARHAGATVSGEGTKLLSDIVMIMFVSAGVVAILAFVYDQPITGLIATSGFLAAIIGFALRNMIADLFSGIALNIEKPFAIGDWIEIESGEQGEIIEMNWRATRLVTVQGRMVVVPNGRLADGKFINLYRPERPFRTVKTLVVDYQAPPQRVVDIFLSAMESTDGVLPDYPNVVLIEKSVERGIEYGLHFWVEHAVKRYLIERQVVINAIEFLNQAGLTPAYPKMDITVARPQLRKIKRGTDLEILLGRVELRQPLPSDAIKALAEEVELQEFTAGSSIVEQGDAGGSLFVLVSGLADVYVTNAENEREQRVASLHPEQVFGEISLLTGQQRGATITAVTAVNAVEVRKSDLQPILEKYPSLVGALSPMQ
ncbi:MAG: mechanosensitive ion channel family protein, partial [Gammaproteobacteria bacterium]|nr:mechanosensitive ion channel family protein [Gammaproteobacteria bacterium]